MAGSGDVQVAQDGAVSAIKLHPYFVALIRWCVSSVWSTATLVLHRFMTAPLPPATGELVEPVPGPPPHPTNIIKGKVCPRPPKPRPASSDHLHPEPRVDCVVLHAPDQPTVDVIFVHGLYGSLGNTWRQGEWRSKYKTEITKVPLRRSDSIPKPEDEKTKTGKEDMSEQVTSGKEFDNMFKGNDVSFQNDENKFYEDIRKILPKENAFITEKFYNNTLLDQVEVSNYETQANFVKDLFEREESENGCVDKTDDRDCDCKLEEVKCEVGCGCVCDECYSPCWPRDWVRVDYPGARVISINYTSDPYLWRPLWIKESKRLRLHERAQQMTAQLLALGVGSRPIVWVGHSKGGLFIKQIYCDAFEAHQKLNNVHTESQENSANTDQLDNVHNNEYSDDNIINHNIENKETDSTDVNNVNDNETYITRINDEQGNEMQNECVYIENSIKEAFHFDKETSNLDIDIDCKRDLFNDVFVDKTDSFDDRSIEDDAFRTDDEVIEVPVDINGNSQREEPQGNEVDQSSNEEEDEATLRARAALWSRSAGFMFYSVPHRGSPLADIKTPITTRSIELMEICKDCSLVLSLQRRWLLAAAPAQPAVRSLVETGRTLMSVLWLRIVSQDSADPGIGSLSGVSVDHREICKPSSRRCPLYGELMRLMRAALPPHSPQRSSQPPTKPSHQ